MLQLPECLRRICEEPAVLPALHSTFTEPAMMHRLLTTYLPAQSVAKLMLTSRCFVNFAMNKDVWQKQCARQFPGREDPFAKRISQLSLPVLDKQWMWLRLYGRRHQGDEPWIAQTEAHQFGASCFALLSDNRLAVASKWQTGLNEDSGLSAIWQNGRKIQWLNAPSLQASCIAEWPDERRVVTATYCGKIFVWGNAEPAILTLIGHRRAVTCLKQVNGCMVSGSMDHTVRVWDIDGSLNTTLTEHAASITCLEVWGENGLATASLDGIVCLYTSLWAFTHILIQPGFGSVCCMTRRPEGGLAVGHKNGAVVLWDANAKEEFIFDEHVGAVRGLAVDGSTGNLLSGDASGSVIHWSPSGDLLGSLSERSRATSFVFLTSSGVFTGFQDGKIRIDTSSMQGIATFMHSFYGVCKSPFFALIRQDGTLFSLVNDVDWNRNVQSWLPDVSALLQPPKLSITERVEAFRRKTAYAVSRRVQSLVGSARNRFRTLALG